MAERNLDFDKIIDRRGTGSMKYDFAVEMGKPEDVLPLWVADMDFKTSSYIEDALIESAHHCIFGYTDVKAPYFEAVKGWMKKQHNWEIKEDWLVKTPGVVFALATAVRAYTETGDSILIQNPVYYPFSNVIRHNGRRIVSSNLYLGEDLRYHIDYEDFERKIVSENVKMFILCSPHNPVGRVWTREELEKIGEICVKHHVVIVSDEIHSDFIFKGEHQVFASIKPEFADNSVICTAPSKTFNLAGLPLSNIFIPNQTLRDKFKRALRSTGLGQIAIPALIACETAYTQGEEWYQGLMSYIRRNIEYTRNFVAENLPNVKMIDIEGTYLIWLDLNGTGLSDAEIEDMITNKAKLWLDGGSMFGKCGEGFQRINVACPRSTLTEALTRIKNAL